MFLIIGNNNSLLLETSLTLLKLPYILINSYDSLVKYILKLDDQNIKQLFILKSNTSINKNINNNIDKLLSLNDNCIIGYKKNFLLESSKIDSLNCFSIEIQDSFCAFNNNKIYINALATSLKNIKDLVDLNLINVNILKLFDTIVDKLNINELTLISYFDTVSELSGKIINIDEKNTILGNIKLPSILKDIKNNNKLIYDNNIIKDSIESEWIYSQIIESKFNSKESIIFICCLNKDDIYSILDEIKEHKINIFINRLVIFNPLDILDLSIINQLMSKKDLNINIINLKVNFNCLSNFIKGVKKHNNVIIITHLKEIKYLSNKRFNHMNLNDSILCYTFPKFLYEGFNLDKYLIFDEIDDNEGNNEENNNDDNKDKDNGNVNNIKYKNNIYLNNIIEFKKKISFIALKNFTEDNEVHNINHKTYTYSNNDNNNLELRLDINLNCLDNYYDKKEYDYIYEIIKFTLINRISFKPEIVFKSLSIIPNCNYLTSEDDIEQLIKLVEINNYEELFSIGIILLNEEFYNSVIKMVLNFISKNTELDQKHKIMILYLLDRSDYFIKEIDIIEDIKIIDFLLEDTKELLGNLNHVSEIDKDFNINTFKKKIFSYLITRILLVDSNEKITIINELIKDNLNFDFNNLKNETNFSILKQLEENALIIINSVTNLSDCMISKEDINQKRYNITKMFEVLNNKTIIREYEKFNINNKNTYKEDTINYEENNDFIDNIIKKFNISTQNYLELISVFKYSYHGIPNKKLFTNIMKFSEKLLKLILLKDYASNKFVNELSKQEDFFDYKFTNTNKKKICFISDFLGLQHSVFKDRHQVIKDLIGQNYEVYIATYNKFHYKYSRIFEGIKENIILIDKGSDSFLKNVEKLREYNFDKVIFCELGMDGRTHVLANFRLGRVQFNTWGHSDTSGMRMIDYYVSSKLYELPYEISKEHYSEKLILQNSLCTSYVNPTSNYQLNSPRSFYGLSKNEFIILCPQSLFKIHPDFDEYIFEILYQNKDVNIVFVDALNKKFRMFERWEKKLNKLDIKYQNVLSRIKFIGTLSHQKFVNLIKLCDFMIDPYPFGGCNTSFEAFSLNIPLVTQPSNMINGRFTYGFYKKMGFTDLIANSKEEYVNLCTRLVNNDEFNKNMRNKINNNKEVLFQDQETLEEWRELMSREYF